MTTRATAPAAGARPTARAGRPKTSDDAIRCVDPATQQRLGEVPVTSPEEVTDTVRRAREAQRAWACTSFAQRRRVLRHVLDHVLRHADELCEVIVRDAGKTRENAMMGEIWPVSEKLRWTIAHGEKHLRPERVSPGLFVHKRATVEYQPRGVVGVISPWNYPLQNILGPTIPALFAGNAVVVKPSEWVAWSSARVQRVFDEALTAAGHSTDLVQIVDGFADTGKALFAPGDDGVDQVIFTGSVPNGKKIIAQSAETVTPLVLELGGKDALIVCDDADMEQALHAAMAGVFIAAGQNCLAAERILVFDTVYEDFERRIVELVRGLRQGSGLEAPGAVDVGAMTTPAQVEICEELVNDAVQRGARVLAGGGRGDDAGTFFQPTLLADVTEDMRIATEETFGPVMVLMRVRDEDDAVRLTNATQFGLGATVMTRSGRRARRMAREIVSGGTSINEFGLTYMAQALPFGGAKASGFGRLNGREGLRACTNQKAVLHDRFPIHQPAKLYPVGPRDYDTVREVIRTIYSPKLGDRAKAARALVRGLVRKGG